MLAEATLCYVHNRFERGVAIFSKGDETENLFSATLVAQMWLLIDIERCVGCK